MASTLSLAITLLELKECGGQKYASQVIKNSQTLALALMQEEFEVAAAERNFTMCHQVWAFSRNKSKTEELYNNLINSGIMINLFNGLPGINNPAYRLSPCEATRRGATMEDMQNLACIMATILRESTRAQKQINELKQRTQIPRYCYDIEDIIKMGLPDYLIQMCKAIIKMDLAVL